MNRITKLYALCIVLLASLFGGSSVNAAERVAPTLPDSVFRAFEDDKDYYLYNVERNEIVSYYISNGSYFGCTGTPLKLHVKQESAGCNSIKVVGANKYWYLQSWSSDIVTTTDYNSGYGSWNIVPAAIEGDYNIQISVGKSNYNENQFVGFSLDASDTRLYYNKTADQAVTWRLISGDAAEVANLFAAKKRLYTAMENVNIAGVNIDQYEAIYASDTSTADECWTAAYALERGTKLSNEYKFPSWNEYPILLGAPDGEWSIWNDYVESRNSVANNATITLTATVVVDGDATLCFENRDYDYFDITLLLDGNVADTYAGWELQSKKRRFVEMGAGVHTVTWIMTNKSGSSQYAYIYNIGVRKTPTISVSLLEPGSLGTEILFQPGVERLQEVRKLKIAGAMNDDDWAKIDMIKSDLFMLDLSEAKITSISKERFENLGWLHTVVLPEGLKVIDQYAFYNTPLVNVNFPSTLTSIRYEAFYSTCIKEAILPDGCELATSSSSSTDGRNFAYCKRLRNVKLPSTLTRVPGGLFYECRFVSPELHEGITRIESSAFYGCYSMHTRLPQSLTYIGSSAFPSCHGGGAEEGVLMIPDNVTYIGGSAFSNANGYTTAIVPVNIYQLESSNFLPDNIKTIKLKCPTVIKQNGNRIVSDGVRAGITLQVPSFLVPSYKLDSYWYNFGKIEGFDTEEIDYWVLRNDLSLGANQRMLGTPSIKICTGGGSLKIGGTDPMPINNLMVQSDPDNNSYGRIFCDAEGVTVAGDMDIHLRAGTKNRWYYACLPFNVKVSDIVPDTEGRKRAIRYYDGANRAENGTGNNWRNFDENDIIPAGTGFIFMTSEACWWYLPSQDDDSKQYMTSTRMFVKELEPNTSTVASNHGWNLVGNPYQCWYNIHKINFTAPITVRNISRNTYEAYSIIDDDYALAPNQAFFVQCPTGTTEISFPLEGRQMTSAITSQNGAPIRNPQAKSRQLIDIVMGSGEMSDRTRVVMNDAASMDYELERDASKFMSEAAVPQLYTIDDEGNEYAINERPFANGTVQLGIVIPADGDYTMSLQRNGARKVMLKDNETGDVVDITASEYAFRAERGMSATRFVLIVEGDEATGVAASAADGLSTVGVYTISGVKVPDANSLPAGTYIVKSAQGKVSKINVK